MPELLDRHEVIRPLHDDHGLFFAGRIATSGGVVRFIQEGFDGVEDQYFFVGGLVSGCAYDMPACETAQTGAQATMVRHANRSYDPDVLDVDAAEIAEAVNVLADGRRVHIVGHSKGTLVALKAAAKVESSVDLASIIIDSPVIGVGVNRHNVGRKVRRLPRVAANMSSAMLRPRWTHFNAQQGSQKEIFKRMPAIVAETGALLFGGQGITRVHVEQVRERKGPSSPIVIMAYGNHDNITHADDIEEAVDQGDIHFDSVIKFTEPGENDHLAIINNPAVMQRILRREAELLHNLRRIAA